MNKTIRQLVLLGILVFVAIIMLVVFAIMGIIGIANSTDGCIYRYDFSENGSLSGADQLTDTVTIRANANYTPIVDSVTPDPSGYGKWYNTNIRVSGNQKLVFDITGEVSLCQAYLPINNLQSDSDKDINGKLIPIPRVEDTATPPVTLYLDAKTDKWKNLAQIFMNDKIIVSLAPDQKTTSDTSLVYNSIEQGLIAADCREGKRSYDPICGRYSIWDDSDYVSSCGWDSTCVKHDVPKKCKGWNLAGLICIGGWEDAYSYWTGCRTTKKRTAPEPYDYDGKYTSPWYDNISLLITDFNPKCSNNHSYINGAYQDKKYFWFSANNAAGLLYRFDTSINPTNASSRGSDYKFAKIEGSFEPAENKTIMDFKSTDLNVRYLQYRFHDTQGEFAGNTGGYVFNVKQTKCRRINGGGFDDTFQGRGVIQYVIPAYGSNPNETAPNSVNNILANANGAGELVAPSDADGYLWLKINNDPNDYQDSIGQYDIQFFTSLKRGKFYENVLDPFFTGLKDKIKNTSITIFKNLTCYQGIGGTDNCTNFFQYIKAMLILYITLYGMMFLLGIVKISQTDLVIRVIKVGIVSGLINDSTFEFFNTYVFDFVTGFSDDIMSNLSGYSMFTGNVRVSNPFMFLDAVMSRVFFSSAFIAQMMSLTAMGLNGVFYFIIVFVSLCILIIVAFRSIAVYLMALMAISVLIGLAPLFLTFILFERTWYLFDNWVHFMFRYMIEPVIVLAGIVILTQLFTVYLDQVIGHSVCWKCVLPFKLPFSSIPGITPAFLDLELFCINWFAPWGFDHRTASMGISMQHIIALMMISYCMWGYLDFAHKITARLVGTRGGPSAISMGGQMSGAFGQKALGTVGLDAQSRQAIKSEFKQRAKEMRRMDRRGESSQASRYDNPVSRSQGNESAGRTSGSNPASNSLNRTTTAPGNPQATGANVTGSGPNQTTGGIAQSQANAANASDGAGAQNNPNQSQTMPATSVPRQSGTNINSSASVQEESRETPGSSNTDRPGETPGETPGSSNTDRPGETPGETPGSSNTDRPGETPGETPESSNTDRPGVSNSNPTAEGELRGSDATEMRPPASPSDLATGDTSPAPTQRDTPTTRRANRARIEDEGPND